MDVTFYWLIWFKLKSSFSAPVDGTALGCVSMRLKTGKTAVQSVLPVPFYSELNLWLKWLAFSFLFSFFILHLKILIFTAISKPILGMVGVNSHKSLLPHFVPNGTKLTEAIKNQRGARDSWWYFITVFILQDCRTRHLFPGLNPAKSSFAFRVDFVNFTFCTHKSNFACSSLICTCIFLQTLTSASSSRHHWLYLCHNLNGKISHLAPSSSDKCLKALNQLVFFFSETIISGINRQPAEFTFHSVSDIRSWYKRGGNWERFRREKGNEKAGERWWMVED